LALLVSRNGAPIREQGFGLANLELHVPATPKTIFQSGSVGKQFTATAVMLLLEEGKIGLDDPLSKYFAEAHGCFSTHIARYLDDGLTIVILTNQANCNPQLIVDEVAALYLAKGDSR
jgi:Beta-lactamase